MATTAPPLSGLDINLAARTTRLALVADLERIDTTFEEWVTINLVGTGQAPTATALHQRLAPALGLDAGTIDGVLDALVGTAIVARDGDQLALTDTGRTRWHEGQAIVAEIVDAFYTGFDAEDLATTRRVLVEVTER